jgi:orotate phosphoribosyltransferase
MIDLGNLLETSGAVLRGHFLLTSGRHSDLYVEKFRVLEQPHVLTVLCQGIAERFASEGIDLVAGPTTGGIIVAYDVARHMGLPAIYVESENGTKKLRRGAHIPSGARVLLVDDVLTTGTSLREVADLVTSSGGILAGVGVLIERTEMPVEFGCPLFAAHRVEAKSYPPDDIPNWLNDIPVTKPGTRVTPAGS